MIVIDDMPLLADDVQVSTSERSIPYGLFNGLSKTNIASYFLRISKELHNAQQLVIFNSKKPIVKDTVAKLSFLACFRSFVWPFQVVGQNLLFN